MKKILISALSLLLPLALNAQFMNRIGADEDAFRAYSQARTNVYAEENIAIGDSLYQVGVRRNDPKIKILALNLQGRPLAAAGDTLRLEKVAAEIQDLYDEYPAEVGDVYYTFMFEHIQTILQEGHNYEATLLARRMATSAEKDGNPYGRFIAYRALAHVYLFRNNLEMCVKTLKSALDFAETVDVNAPGDLLMTKLQYAQYLSYIKGHEQESLELMDELEKDPMMDLVKATNPLFLPSVRANAYFSIQDKDNYLKAYDEMTSNPYYSAVIEPERRYMYEGYYLVCKGRFDEALEKADSIQNTTYACDIRQVAYEGKGDWKKAEEVLLERLANQAEIFQAYQSEDVAVLDAELDNGALREAAHTATLKLQQGRFAVVLGLMAILLLFTSIMISRSQKHVKELQAVNAAKDMFIKNMSHEVRTPLNAITGYSQLLAMPEGMLSDEDKEEFQEYIMSNSNILTMLIDDILDASDIESGNYNINYSVSFPDEICRDSVRSAERRLPSGVEMKYEVNLPDGFSTRTDPRRVQQILVNLLCNACKNTEEGEIRLSCKLTEDGTFVEYAVEDTGCGIAPENAEKIFERYYKVDQFKQGIGIGLSICRAVTEKMGGTIALDTSYSSGARFVLRLPA